MVGTILCAPFSAPPKCHAIHPCTFFCIHGSWQAVFHRSALWMCWTSLASREPMSGGLMTGVNYRLTWCRSADMRSLQDFVYIPTGCRTGFCGSAHARHISSLLECPVDRGRPQKVPEHGVRLCELFFGGMQTSCLAGLIVCWHRCVDGARRRSTLFASLAPRGFHSLVVVVPV